jgi:hypothetical protein
MHDVRFGPFAQIFCFLKKAPGASVGNANVILKNGKPVLECNPHSLIRWGILQFDGVRNTIKPFVKWEKLTLISRPVLQCPTAFIMAKRIRSVRLSHPPPRGGGCSTPWGFSTPIPKHPRYPKERRGSNGRGNNGPTNAPRAVW